MKQILNNITSARVAIMLIFIVFALPLQAQQDEKKKQEAVLEHLREAQEYLESEDFASAEASYRKAISKDPSSVLAKYNMGNLYYEKAENTNAEARLKQASEIAGSKEEKHRIFHNLGNSFMRQKNYKAAVEAYKDALRNVPTDEETRYNLALAKQMLEKQQQEQDQNKDKNDDQKENQDQNQDNEDQQGDGGEDEKKEGDPKDEGEDKEDESEGEKDKEDKKDEKNDEEGNEDKPDEGGDEQQQQPEPLQGQLSKEQIKSLLEAMNNEEKKVQDKINAEKAKGVKMRSEKDW